MQLRAVLEFMAAVLERRRRVKALHVTGYKYDEIAERLGVVAPASNTS